MKFDHLRATYFEECAELIESAYAQLTALADGNANDDTVHALFRAIHSVKGGGGAFGFNRVVGLAHVMETLLDQLRDGVLAFTPDLVALLLRGTDALADMLNAERNGTQIRDGFEDQLISLFNEAAGQAAPNEGEVIAQVKAEGHTGWRIEFRPHAALFRHANEPLLLVRELRRLGEVAVTADWTRLPTLNEISAEDSYLNWRFELLAEVTRDKIEEVFEFVMDDCELTIEPISDDSDVPTSKAAIETITVAAGLKPAGTSLLGVKAPLTTEEAPANITPAQSVRVDVSKVDRLVNLVGELVINQAMLVQLGSTLPPDLCPGLISGLETLSQHLRELQEGVMAIRTQPVRLVFARMPRLVRELSSTLNKDARLIITGEATEIDKTVVEQLADPLTHLLRNALDHGIEPPDEREAAGKPRQGTVHLSAEQRSGRIVIEVSDDGRGINRERVLARAKERNLILADAQLTDAEINELIFLPSFSTAATVSAVSGRGVGMDVVRRNIQALGGRIAVESNQGSGSRFILSLPLTLAVLDGLVVSVGQEAYILPISTIVESLRPNKRDIHSVTGHGEVLSIRGAYVPLLQLHQRFGVRDAVTDPSRGIVVIVETDKAGHLGLVVDDLVGQQQVVVKSLETNYQPVEGIGGATILGDGRVALILDIAGLATASATYTPPPQVPQARLQMLPCIEFKGKNHMELALPSHAPPPPIGVLAAQMASSSSQFITCTLGEAEYGIDIMSVREIKGWTETTSIPYAPPWIRGVINLRGTIVPILDLRARFRQEPTVPTPMHVVVIIQTESRTAGLLVDAVSDIITVNSEEIRAVPEIGTQAPEQLLSGLVPLERGMVALVSLQHLIAFQMDEIAEAASAITTP